MIKCKLSLQYRKVEVYLDNPAFINKILNSNQPLLVNPS